jgi:hypothetical protein
MSNDRTPEDQADYDAKVDQIAATPAPKLVAGPFAYHRPVTTHSPSN